MWDNLKNHLKFYFIDFYLFYLVLFILKLFILPFINVIILQKKQFSTFHFSIVSDLTCIEINRGSQGGSIVTLRSQWSQWLCIGENILHIMSKYKIWKRKMFLNLYTFPSITTISLCVNLVKHITFHVFSCNMWK